jgi:hypothetical protein
MLIILLYQVADFDDLEEDKFLNAVVKVGFKNALAIYDASFDYNHTLSLSLSLENAGELCFIILITKLDKNPVTTHTTHHTNC